MKTSISRLIALNLALIMLLPLVFPVCAVEMKDSSDVITDPAGSYKAGTYYIRLPETGYYVSERRLSVFISNRNYYVHPLIETENQEGGYTYRFSGSQTYQVSANQDFTLQEQSIPLRVPMGESEIYSTSDATVFIPEKEGYYHFSTVTHLDLSLYDQGKQIGDITNYLTEDKRDFYVHLLANISYAVSASGVARIEMVPDPFELTVGSYETDGLYTPAETGWYELVGMKKIYDITRKTIDTKLGFYYLEAESTYYIDISGEELSVSLRPEIQELVLDRDLEAGYYSFRPTVAGLYRFSNINASEDNTASTNSTTRYMEAGQEVEIYRTEAFRVSYIGLHGYYSNNDGTITYSGYYGKDRVLKIPEQINGMKVTGVSKAFSQVCDPFYGKRVELPYGVETLRSGAVSHQENRIIDVVLPESLKTIGSRAFASCLDLILTVPQSLEEIAPDATRNYEGNPFNHVYYAGTEAQWEQLVANAPNFSKKIETFHANAGKDDYVVEYRADGVATVFCKICDRYIRGVCDDHGEGVFVPKAGETQSCDSVCKGTVQCTRCNQVLERDVVMPAVDHCFRLQPLNDSVHIVACDYCDYLVYEAHEGSEATCPCTETTDTVYVDDSIRIYHSLNLTGNIGIHFVVSRELVAGYHPKSLYMEIASVDQDGELVTTKLLPTYQYGMYYFSYTDTNAVTINDVVEATFYGCKDGKTYRSNVDEYSVAEYAYSQLSKANASAKLKTLCANLLRYGAAAQIYKNYHTDALADAAMTPDHRAYLTAPEDISFKEADKLVSELEGATVSLLGKSLLLDSTITLRYVVDLTNYDSDPDYLSLHIAYTDIDGNRRSRYVNEVVPYGPGGNLYCFDFDGLLAAEMRTDLTITVYEVEKPVSHSYQSCVASYGNGKTGDLLTLCQALMAYSDAAYAYFCE